MGLLGKSNSSGKNNANNAAEEKKSLKMSAKEEALMEKDQAIAAKFMQNYETEADWCARWNEDGKAFEKELKRQMDTAYEENDIIESNRLQNSRLLRKVEEKHPELEYLVDKHHILNPDENSGGKVMESKVLDVGKSSGDFFAARHGYHVLGFATHPQDYVDGVKKRGALMAGTHSDDYFRKDTLTKNKMGVVIECAVEKPMRVHENKYVQSLGPFDTILDGSWLAEMKDDEQRHIPHLELMHRWARNLRDERISKYGTTLVFQVYSKDNLLDEKARAEWEAQTPVAEERRKKFTLYAVEDVQQAFNAHSGWELVDSVQGAGDWNYFDRDKEKLKSLCLVFRKVDRVAAQDE